jgi:hypothetical protein
LCDAFIGKGTPAPLDPREISRAAVTGQPMIRHP